MNKYSISVICLTLAVLSPTAKGALPSLSCAMPPKLENPIVIYGDSTNPTFSENIWGATVTTTSNANSGNNALEVEFETEWSGIEFNSFVSYEPNSIGAVQLAIKGSMSGHNVRIYLLDKYGKKLGLDVALSDYLVSGFTPDWQVAWVPIPDMLMTASVIGGVGIQSEIPGVIWVDDIKFVAPEPKELITLYSEQLHGKLHGWLNYLSVDTKTPFAGGSAIEMKVDSSWGGLTIRSNRTISENDFGAITFAVKTDTNNLDLYVYAVNEDGGRIGLTQPVSEFLYGGAVPENWQVAWIPIHTLIPHPVQGPFVFHGIGIEATMPGTVWLDEVKVVEKLRWMLPEYSASISSSFGSLWSTGTCADGTGQLLHTGSDYRTNQESGGRVNAAHAGTVRFVATDATWGGYVVVESIGKAFHTSYLHVVPSVSVGDSVSVGSKIGVIADQSANGGNHLHFQLRVQDYNQTLALRGRLPSKACNVGFSFIEPKFPEAFVNSILVDWQ